MSKRLLLLILIALAVGVGQSQAQQGNQPPPAIVSFDTNVQTISMTEAEAESVNATFEWQVIQLTARYHLELQRYQFNQWQTVPFETALLAQDRREVAIQHPLNFGPPMVRLVVIETGPTRIVEERVLVIPYAETTGAPQIEQFSTDTPAIGLPAYNARMPVVWQVSNRGPLTNLVFEQIYADGRAG